MDNLHNLNILTDNHLKILMKVYSDKQNNHLLMHNKRFDIYEDNIYKIYKEQVKRSIKSNSKIDIRQ
jgi:hypothetical protein